jgi:hypothetical protein
MIKQSVGWPVHPVNINLLISASRYCVWVQPEPGCSSWVWLMLMLAIFQNAEKLPSSVSVLR